MTTAWGKFRDFINSKEIGYTFDRKDLTAKLGLINPGTLLGYLSLTKQAKFIERVGRGHYKLVEHLPENLTMGSLFALLRGDNLTYVESIQHQKDFKVLKAQFIHERNYVLTKLIEDLKPLVAYAEQIEVSAFGLKQLARNCKWQRSKMSNPHKNMVGSERRK